MAITKVAQALLLLSVIAAGKQLVNTVFRSVVSIQLRSEHIRKQTSFV